MFGNSSDDSCLRGHRLDILPFANSKDTWKIPQLLPVRRVPSSWRSVDGSGCSGRKHCPASYCFRHIFTAVRTLSFCERISSTTAGSLVVFQIAKRRKGPASYQPRLIIFQYSFQTSSSERSFFLSKIHMSLINLTQIYCYSSLKPDTSCKRSRPTQRKNLHHILSPEQMDADSVAIFYTSDLSYSTPSVTNCCSITSSKTCFCIAW